ncbi:MAG: hypothetical protein V3T43_02870 [Nitrosomonadaceae bacterium]
MENLSPKVTTGEIPPKVRNIQGVATSTFANVGLYEKGPIGIPKFIAGPEEFSQVFGRETGQFLGRRSLARGFENGLSRGFITRTAHYTDISDAATLTAINASILIDDRLPNDGVKASGLIKVTNNAIEAFIQSSGFVDVINNTFDVGDAITINGTSLTLGAEWAAGIDTDASAIAIKDAINGAGALTGVVTAAINGSNPSRIDITSVVFGTVGDAITLAETDGATDNFTLSGANLAGGVNGDSLNVNGITLEFGNDISIGVDAAATVLNIITAVDAISNTDAALDAADATNTTVKVEHDVIGLAGNAKVFTKVDADNDITLTPATGTLLGGLETDAEESLLITAADGEGTHANNRIAQIKNARNGLADHFRLEVRDANGITLLDAFDDVNLDTQSDNYVETRVNGKGQKLITVADQMSSNTASNNNLPAIGTHLLIGGNDGLTGLNDLDFQGDAASKTGMYSWDTIENQFALASVPDRRTSVIQKFGGDRATTKQHYLFINDAPFDLDVQGVISFKRDNGISSEHGAMHWPEVVIQDRDPAAKGAEIVIPNSGVIMGLMARVDAAAGKGVAKAAAGVNDGRMFGILRTNNDATQEEGNRDVLAPEGINVIWSEQGVGVHNDGSKLTKQDGLVSNVNERRVFIFVETSVKLGTKFAKHENIDAALFNSLNRAITLFLTRFGNQGGLKGRTSAERFFVDTSFGIGTLNPPSSQEAQQVNVQVGLATKKPALFINIDFTVDQRSLLTEIEESAS